MAWGCSHVAKVSLNVQDLEGVLNVLARRVGGLRPPDVDDASFHAGAYHALSTCLEHEWRDQEEFFAIFDGLMDRAVEEVRDEPDNT